MTITREQLVAAFSDCVGREKAQDVITGVVDESNLDNEGPYDETEAIEIATGVANRSDTSMFIRTAANTLQTRIRTGNL